MPIPATVASSTTSLIQGINKYYVYVLAKIFIHTHPIFFGFKFYPPFQNERCLFKE
tara:strand:+ start:377 stop:544 length:168 start_codon:yes stop_codon:yes gene_type:complete